MAGNPQPGDVLFSCGRGQRILVLGANGADKSTLLSILGGKHMVPRGLTRHYAGEVPCICALLGQLD